ncbi:hypothetical protein CFOL_v3_31320 [Cephalotus follicularis]|uniref:DUF7610 domain-containing protein n=1 Tax=Cephalotus follicularis TaxID=3775 RepID=A0A1Q3D5V2_CEPFO|nr:hypothetical protein CFOL_v3_31320 [Cephalotus follicularis]
MTKNYTILRRKLQELETKLDEAVSLPQQEHTQFDAQDIEQSFVFLKNLLSAEIALHPSKPRHLNHMDNRLTELETSFHKWVTSKTLTDDDHIETVSTCSCTESCLNDDGEASAVSGSLGFEETEMYLEDLHVEEKLPMEMVCLEAKRDVKREEKKVMLVGTYCGVMASGVVVGVALMGLVMVKFSGCFHYVEYGSFMTPT